jgi:predicted ArsR family transcriptional regulator
MIVDTITNASQFRDRFHAMGRGNQFSYDGLGILFDYIDQLSDDIGEPFEMDVVAVCCYYAEDTVESIAQAYSIDIAGLDDDEASDKVTEYLEDEGHFVGVTDAGAIVYHQH